MTRLEADIHEDAISIINKLAKINDTGFELVLPEGSVLFDNILNLKLIRKEADKLQKTVEFSTTDTYGQNIIQALEEKNVFQSPNTMPSTLPGSTKIPFGGRSKLHNLYKKARAGITFPVRKIGLLLPLGLVVVLAGGFGLIWQFYTVQVNLTVAPQPLIKSLPVKIQLVKTDAPYHLIGYQLTSTVVKSAHAPTTGQKVVGKKASGKIRILNKTLSSKKFKSGEILRVNDDSINATLDYILKKDVEVPQAVESHPDELTTVITAGEADAEIEAKEIGDTYNIKKDIRLKFRNYDSADYSATVKSTLSGGESRVAAIVTQQDLDALATIVQAQISADGTKSLTTKLTSDKVLIKGSTQIQPTNVFYNAKLDDEVDDLTYTYEGTIKALTYTKADLDQILKASINDFIPNDYEISSENIAIETEVLGNSDSSVLSSTEADLQATIKALVQPKLDLPALKRDLKMKPFKYGQAKLENLKNIERVELKPNIGIFNFFPLAEKNIIINLTVHD